MSQIRLKCDDCGGIYRDVNVKVLCSSCSKRLKKELITEFNEVLDEISGWSKPNSEVRIRCNRYMKNYKERLKG